MRDNVFSRYTGFQLIGRGSIGSVNACIDPNLNRRIAVKTLHPEFQGDGDQQARFIREARLMAAVEHPNVVPIYEVGFRDDGSLYFTMKEVNGLTFGAILKGLFNQQAEMMNAWPFQSLLDVFLQICHAVSFAHSKGIIHRDLKPDNVLVGVFGEVLVLDWGLARFIDDSDILSKSEFNDVRVRPSALGSTLDGQVMGTPNFMAPEQARGEVSSHDFRTDIYALGGILYEVLTLQSPVRSLQVDDILEEVGGDTRIQTPREAMKHSGRIKREGSLTSIPRELDAICMKALAKNPEDRYQRVEEVVRDLQAWRNHMSVSVCPDSRFRKTKKWLRRQPFFVAIVGTGLAVLMTIWMSLIVVDQRRLNDFADRGDVHRMEGSSLVHESLLPLMQLREAPQESDLNDEARRVLRHTVETRYRDIKAAYEVALILYARASRRGADQRIMAGNREIHANYLRMALLLEDKQEAKLRLDIIRNWTGEGFEGSQSATRDWLQNISDWCEGGVYLDLMSLVRFTAKERALIEGAGYDPDQSTSESER